MVIWRSVRFVALRYIARNGVGGEDRAANKYVQRLAGLVGKRCLDYWRMSGAPAGMRIREELRRLRRLPT